MVNRRIGDLLTAALVALALAGFVWSMSPAEQASEIAGPAHVVDGDSLEIAGRSIRLEGLDAPEGRQSCTRDGHAWPCGREAAKALLELIGGRPVTCRSSRLDQYDRMLATCRVGDTDINRWLVSEGWAVSYGAYWDEERDAGAARRGVWSGDFERPSEWRARHRRSGGQARRDGS